MANAKFSMNIDFDLQNVLGISAASGNGLTLGGSGGGSGGNSSSYASSNYYSSESNNTYINTLNDNFENTSLPQGQLDGFCFADKSTKIAYLGFTAWGAFPVKYTQDGTEYYTICLDGGANTETKVGGNMSDEGNERSALPQPISNPADQNKAIEHYLTVLGQNNRDLYRVGCGVHSATGNSYLHHFYPDVKWAENAFGKLNKAKALIAEITIPISSTAGNTIYLAVVDGGHNTRVPKDYYTNRGVEYGNIDISTAVCSLSRYRHLFTTIDCYTHKKDKARPWRSWNGSPLFTEGTYDPINGTISDYGPSQVKAKLNENNGKKFKIIAKFKTSSVNAVTKVTYNQWAKSGRSHFYVKFFVPSVFREKAEKKLGHKLPDDIIIDAATIKEKKNTTLTSKVISQKKYKATGNMSDLARDILNQPLDLPQTNYKTLVDTQSRTIANFKNANIRHVIVRYKFVDGKKIPVKRWKGQLTTNLGKAMIPSDYPMTRNGGSRISYIVVHEKVVERLENAFKDVLKYYKSGSNITRLIPSACIFSNSLRNTSASGMHNIGFAIDLDPNNNQWDPGGRNTSIELKSTFNKPIYEPFVDIMEHHGLRNLGRDSKKWGNNVKDWMHYQAALTSAAAGRGGIKPYYNKPGN